MKVDLQLTVMKPLSTKWIISAFDYLRQDSGIVRSGFIEARILEALNESEVEDCGSESDLFED